MTQQTPIDWLVKQLKSKYNIHIDILAITDKANGMHKEQIEDAFQEGKWNGWEWSKGKEKLKDSTEYYNETYGTK